MLKTLTNILKYFVNLSDVKRVIFFMGASIMFLTYFFIKRDTQNQKQHLEIKNSYIKRLDTCELKNTRYLTEKESLTNVIFNLKIDSAVTSASKEIEYAKKLANQVKQTEKKVKKTTNSLNKKLNQLNEK